MAVSPAQVIGDNGINENQDFNPSLIISHPRGAVALGNDFDASSINDTNYNLYLILYPNYVVLILNGIFLVLMFHLLYIYLHY